jgi:hypothetical protein
MQELNISELKDQVLNLQMGQNIFIDVPSEICKEITLIYFKLQSCENLFNSFISRTSDEVDKFSLEKFIDYHANLIYTRDNLIKKIMISNLGVDVYQIVTDQNSKIRCRLDWTLEKLVIFYVSNNSSCKIK